eukprot:scaffold5901_cov116-Cylindrotheca_fusiformis.AAC.6
MPSGSFLHPRLLPFVKSDKSRNIVSGHNFCERENAQKTMISPIIHHHSVELDSCEKDIHPVKTRHVPQEACPDYSPTPSVSFAPEVSVKQIIGLEEYTQDEIYRSWYSQSETMQISQSCLALLNQNWLLQQEDDETNCMRGLEPHTALGSIARRKNRKASVALVLMEQLEQQEREVVDVDLLAEIYSDATSSSQLWARVAARQDQREAEACLDEEDFLEYGALEKNQNERRHFLSNLKSADSLDMCKVLPRAA